MLGGLAPRAKPRLLNSGGENATGVQSSKGGGRGLGERMRGMNASMNKEEAAAQGSAAAEMGNNSAKGKTTWNT